MRLDLDRVRQNARQADTEDLLDRVTVYRADMEPAALDLIEDELRTRGVTVDQIEAHAQKREAVAIPFDDDAAARCSFCRRPAVEEGWGWHRLWGLLPVFPRRFCYCDRHRPSGPR